MKTHVRFLPTEHPALCRAIALVDTFPRSQAAKLASALIRLGLDLMAGRNATVAPELTAHIQSLNEIAVNPIRDVRRVSIEVDAHILEALHALGAESARAQQALLRASAVLAARLLMTESAQRHIENASAQQSRPTTHSHDVHTKESPTSHHDHVELKDESEGATVRNDDTKALPDTPVQTTHQECEVSDTDGVDPMAIFAQFVSGGRGST